MCDEQQNLLFLSSRYEVLMNGFVLQPVGRFLFDCMCKANLITSQIQLHKYHTGM